MVSPIRGGELRLVYGYSILVYGRCFSLSFKPSRFGRLVTSPFRFGRLVTSLNGGKRPHPTTMLTLKNKNFWALAGLDGLKQLFSGTFF